MVKPSNRRQCHVVQIHQSLRFTICSSSRSCGRGQYLCVCQRVCCRCDIAAHLVRAPCITRGQCSLPLGHIKLEACPSSKAEGRPFDRPFEPTHNPPDKSRFGALPEGGTLDIVNAETEVGVPVEHPLYETLLVTILGWPPANRRIANGQPALCLISVAQKNQTVVARYP